MKMKLYNIGKMKKEANKIYKKKLAMLEQVKIIVRKKGWSDKILSELIKKDFSNSDLILCFNKNHIDILNFALDELNKILENEINKINIINFPINKRIKKILMNRLDILDKDKIFYKKTFNHLMLPQNLKIMKKNLYKTVDSMWYLAGDNSTDFNFYTKRLTLAVIYVNALIVFFNNDYNKAESNIDKNLKIISRIPKFKNRFSFIKENLPIFIKGFFN